MQRCISSGLSCRQSITRFSQSAISIRRRVVVYALVSFSVFRLVRFCHVMMCNLRAAVSACVTSRAVRLTLYLLLCSDVFLKF